MKEVHKLYSNDYGIAFKWKINDSLTGKKIQLVFNDVSLNLSKKKLRKFLNAIELSLEEEPSCLKCENPEECKSYLLDTPSTMVRLAMSYNELKLLKDLIEGAFFQMEIDKLLNDNLIG